MLGIEPGYVLDELSFKAFTAAHAAYDRVRREGWEQTRLIAYYTAAPNLKGKPSIAKFLPLKWDADTVSQAPPSTPERREELKNKLIKHIHNGR